MHSRGRCKPRQLLSLDLQNSWICATHPWVCSRKICHISRLPFCLYFIYVHYTTFCSITRMSLPYTLIRCAHLAYPDIDQIGSFQAYCRLTLVFFLPHFTPCIRDWLQSDCRRNTTSAFSPSIL
ncbi:hypothetical protein BDW68DRAFT_142609 [Aspergillus falconensis]